MAADLIFFGHDARDAAVQRRIGAFAEAGADVLAFTMRRGAPIAPAWRNVDLGETRDAAFLQRLIALHRARPVLAAHKAELAAASVFYARNLDMALLAQWAKSMSGSRAAIVYECLDIHRFMTRRDALGAAMRAMERYLLRRTALVVVSSPAFVREYFDKAQPGAAKFMLVENRLPRGFAYGPRPSGEKLVGQPLRLGWFGNLRCKRSLALLLALADRFPDRIVIEMRGAPARTELSDFEGSIAGRANVRFGGRYVWPDDLAALYASVDLVWAGDFHDPGANSKWLLPNRLYEGGYYGVPPVAPADSETGRWIGEHGFGFTLAEPLEQTLPDFIQQLAPEAIAAARARLLSAPEDVFVQPQDELKRVLDAARGAA